MSPGHIKLEASLDKEVSDNSAILSLTYLNKMCQVVSDPMITVSSYEGNGQYFVSIYQEMADLMVLVVSFISRLKDEKNVSQAGFKLEKEFACYKNI